MTSSGAQPAVDLAVTAAEAVRGLNHHTLGRHALSEPAELDRLVAELATMAQGLPQLITHLSSWLNAEYDAGRIGSDDHLDEAIVVDRALAQLTAGRHAAHELGQFLDDARQQLAHLQTRSTSQRLKQVSHDGHADDR
ncbi:hypothetical protein ACVBEQ_10230 [Nakamurella sp. GG22]